MRRDCYPLTFVAAVVALVVLTSPAVVARAPAVQAAGGLVLDQLAPGPDTFLRSLRGHDASERCRLVQESGRLWRQRVHPVRFRLTPPTPQRPGPSLAASPAVVLPIMPSRLVLARRCACPRGP
ncbi:hypothetical protein LLH23_03080 [bacterium]|nr:hypothetical protein [bacterium]